MRGHDHHVVISSDCHAFVNPVPDLVDTESRDYQRNFDGIVGEVVFPQHHPAMPRSRTRELDAGRTTVTR